MKRYLFPMILSALLVLGLNYGCGGDDDDEEHEEFHAEMTGAKERPAPVTTSATGETTFEVHDESASAIEIEFSVEASGLQNVTMAHIHNGGPEVAGPISVFLCGGMGKPNCNSSGTIASGIITAADLQAGGNITTMAQLVSQMHAGTVYVNVHTTTNPAGAIRGQVEMHEE